ncbi:SOS response-associated peptidase family protein [Rugamonas rubra]|uniref:Abasic site processing protein n=1 Tax=Rugamonas rubra TaxID=758825 RepID=A0A1I4IYN5_9BURK|nr:SOS response-associated peptidase family protein [Rugamonas rubra]SFL59380.1 Putative SOS response-associated peptidase YedK [Rugamonas rubra]
MCGRFDQNDISRGTLAAFGWADAAWHGAAAPTRNAAPGSRRAVLHRHGGAPRLDELYWGYRPDWAAGRVPLAYQARLEKVHGGYWCRLLEHGRALVPVNGWYEWTGAKGARQPWHIHRRDGQPFLLLALASFEAVQHHPAEAGFVLLTAEAGAGLVDLHDRRPLVLAAADAAAWLDPALSGRQAARLAAVLALGAEHFAWHPVSADLQHEVAPPPVQLGLPL